MFLGHVPCSVNEVYRKPQSDLACSPGVLRAVFQNFFLSDIGQCVSGHGVSISDDTLGFGAISFPCTQTTRHYSFTQIDQI